MTTIEITLKREDGGQVRYTRQVIDWETWSLLCDRVKGDVLVNAVMVMWQEMQGVSRRAEFTPDPEAVRPYQLNPPDMAAYHANMEEISRQLRQPGTVFDPALYDRLVPNPEYAQVHAGPPPMTPAGRAAAEMIERQYQEALAEARAARASESEPEPSAPCDEFFGAPEPETPARREVVPF